ncbi:hypothetical protein [Streptomyces mirabilis]|uniref:hypothetical protein n=1 Tax=Streptomyces mirabilis TaxID=68239 RepID=UPI0033CFB43B
MLVLLQCVGRVGAAYQRWQNGPLLDAPRVAFPDAERIIWNAWKTRHVRVRRSLRRQQKEHAAEVVGALRAAEARQYTEADTGEVLEDIVLILLTITARYAEGRTGELLELRRLQGVTPATNFEWVRLLSFGGVVVVAGLGCAVLNLPAAVATPIVALVLVGGSKVLLGHRLGGAETLDLFRNSK